MITSRSVKRVLVASLVAVCSVILWLVVKDMVVVKDQQVANSAIVRFAQKMDADQTPGGKQCSVAVPSPGSAKLEKKMSDTECGNDVVTFFKLENVQSSTIVGLNSEGRCSEGDWTFEVRAIKQPTTSLWLDIRNLKSMQPGDIIAQGVAVDYVRYSHGNIEGKLSCAILYPPHS